MVRRREGDRTVTAAAPGVLRIGFLGSGFIASFHLQALESVRDAVVTGVYSPSDDGRRRFAAEVDARGLGPCTPFPSVEELLGSGEVDAVWVLGPNDTRLEHMAAIHAAVTAGRVELAGVACEKPLARNMGEAA
jgi:predicted dehydrogenase